MQSGAQEFVHFRLFAQMPAGLTALCNIRRNLQYTSELTRWIFENEGTEFVSGVQHATVSTGLTGVSYGLLFGIDVLRTNMKTESRVKYFNQTLRTTLKDLSSTKRVTRLESLANVAWARVSKK